MNDHREPDDRTTGPSDEAGDRFADGLGGRLREVADRVDGRGLTRASVVAAALEQRRRQVRTRGLVVGAAAVVAVLVGLAAVASNGSDGSEDVDTAGPTTTSVEVEGTCIAIEDGATATGWFRLSREQADALRDAGAITAEEARDIDEHAVLLDAGDLILLQDPPVGPVADQVFQLSYEDSAGISFLRRTGRLTADQEAEIADGIAPTLDRDQVDVLMEAFPDLLAVAAGGQPFPGSGGAAFTPSTTAPPATGTGGTACGN